jgi:hypothetical protein
MTQEELEMELEELAVRFSEGWHEGIKIDASDIMLLNKAAQALAQRKPLLASEIVTMYAERPTSDNDMIAFARAIEAAHGIKGGA